MTRGNRLALMAAAVLILAATGTVLATRAPQSQEQPAELLTSHEAEPETEEAPPTAEELAHAAERLTAGEIPFGDAQLADLAARYGLGGAVRILAWAADPSVGMTAEEIAAMRDGDGTTSVGWGRLAKELGTHPGIGRIMGNGGGHGRDDAPGQQDEGSDTGD